MEAYNYKHCRPTRMVLVSLLLLARTAPTFTFRSFHFRRQQQRLSPILRRSTSSMWWTTLTRPAAPRQPQAGVALFASSTPSSSPSSETLTTTTSTTTTQFPQPNQECCNSNHKHNNEEAWEKYTEIMDTVMRENRVIRKRKQITDQQIQLVQDYLLQSKSLNDVKLLGPPPSLISSTLSASRAAATTKDTHNSTNSNNPRKEFRSLLNQRQRAFQEHTNMTSAAFDYCGRALSYIADVCAKHSTPAPCLIAWSKIRECGLIPPENSVSTYMYALSNVVEEEKGVADNGGGGGGGGGSNNKEDENSLQQRQQLPDALLEVAAFHDLLYEPNENSITLRIKTLVAKGDAAAAEECLASLPDKSSSDNENDNSDIVKNSKKKKQQWKRLRTYTPILEYYCNNCNCDSNNVEAILRLFREMKQSDGVYLDGETYARIVGTVARQGWFRDSDTTSANLHNLSQYGFQATTGPALLDELVESMADDLLEIDEVSASTLQHDFQALVDIDDEKIPAARLVARRVSIDNTTAICPETGVKLRLFTLSREQRRRVHDNLLQMAAVEHEEFYKKLQARKRKSTKAQRDGTLALKELSRFSDWLRIREGEPFTAFVDGPNVAYFGNGDMRWHQVQLVVDKLESMGENPLVIMPQKYVAPSFSLSRGSVRMLTDDEVAVMNQLVRDKKVYVVPPDCFDDYYWMLGSIAVQKESDKLDVPPDNSSGRFPGLRPIIVTNDQMRDHRMDLLEERLFRRWTSCHMVKYSIRRYEEEEWRDREVQFFPADFFSCEIQQNVASGFGNSTVWHIPVWEWPKHDRLCLMFLRDEDWT